MMVNQMINTAVEFIYNTVKQFPDKCCISDKQVEFTFKEFFLKAVKVAQTIKCDKVINQPIAVYLAKEVDAIVTFAGILLSGNIYVPIDVNSPILTINDELTGLYNEKYIMLIS